MLTWVKQYSTALLVLVSIIIAGLWVHDHTQQAVARALMQQQVDSITAKVKQDSVDAAARDSSRLAVIAQQAKSEAAALASAQSAKKAKEAALSALAGATTSADTIVALKAVVAQDEQQLADQANAITAADAQIVSLKAQVLDRDGQIASLRGSITDLQQKLAKATKPSVWNGTTLTLVKTVLAAKGAYDVFRGH